MQLRDSFQQVRFLYPEYIKKQRVSSRDPAYVMVVETIPQILRSLIAPDKPIKVEGSTGRGLITPAPWIATFDTRLTDSATKEYYPVYLFSTDLTRLYLSIGLGVQEFKEKYGEGRKLYEQLRLAADKLSVHIADSNLVRGKIDLSANSSQDQHRGYESANIAAIQYDLNNLPDDSILVNDYRRILTHYASLIESPAAPTPEDLAIENLQPPPSVSITFVEFKPRGKRTTSNAKQTYSQARRSKISNKVGRRAEEFVYEAERKRLIDIGCADLCDRVEPHFMKQDYCGWDITSYEKDGAQRYIEVKGSTEKISTVELTSNEWDAARKHGHKFCLYLVSNVFSTNVTIEVIRNPMELVNRGQLMIKPSQYLLDLRTREDE